MKKVSLLLVAAMLALFLTGCGTDSSNGSSGEGKVYKVGIDTTYPPFEYEENGEYHGIDIDLFTAIAENQGFEFEFDAMDFGGIIPAMEAGQLDVAIAGMSITEDRKKVVDFSDPYFDAGLILVVHNDTNDIDSVEDLEGKTVAVKNGTTGAKFAMDNADKYGYEIVQFDDSPAMFQEVSNGNADALIEDYPVIKYAIAKDNLDLKLVGDRLNGDQYGIAVIKGENQDLLEKINQGLQELRDSGEYDEIVNQYLGE